MGLKWRLFIETPFQVFRLLFSRLDLLPQSNATQADFNENSESESNTIQQDFDENSESDTRRKRIGRIYACTSLTEQEVSPLFL